MNENAERKEQVRSDRGSRRWYHFFLALAWPITRLLFLRSVRGRERVPEGPAIFCAPHTSNLDPVLLSVALGWKHYVHHLAKAELFTVPLVGGIMRKIGSIFIHRGESDIEAFKQCIRLLKAGEKLVIFPEGTRIHTPEMGEIKPGALRMAQKLAVPVVPVYITRNARGLRQSEVVFGEPYLVERSRGADPEALAEDLKARILALEPR